MACQRSGPKQWKQCNVKPPFHRESNTGNLNGRTWSSGFIIDPKGASAAQQRPKVQDFIKQKRRVLLIDVFQAASAAAPRNRSHNHFLTFNLSDDACGVQDILTALAFLQKSQSKPVELVGSGDAAIWSYFAAAVAPAAVDLHADISSFKGSDEEFLRVLNVPGIQRAGGLAAKLALTESK